MDVMVLIRCDIVAQKEDEEHGQAQLQAKNHQGKAPSKRARAIASKF
jgi:hypothetical protein